MVNGIMGSLGNFSNKSSPMITKVEPKFEFKQVLESKYTNISKSKPKLRENKEYKKTDSKSQKKSKEENNVESKENKFKKLDKPTKHKETKEIKGEKKELKSDKKEPKNDLVLDEIEDRIENIENMVKEILEVNPDISKDLEEILNLLENLKVNLTKNIESQSPEFISFLNQIETNLNNVITNKNVNLNLENKISLNKNKNISSEWQSDILKNKTDINAGEKSENLEVENIKTLDNDKNVDFRKIIKDLEQKVESFNKATDDGEKSENKSLNPVLKDAKLEFKQEALKKNKQINSKDEKIASKEQDKESNIDLGSKNIEILKNENTLIRSAKLSPKSVSENFEKNVMKQVTDFTQNSIKVLKNSSEMILKLKPENLGKVSLKLTIHKGVVEAEFNVENQSVKAILESNLMDLKNSLSNKGYQLEGLDVSVDQGDKEHSDNRHHGSRQKNKMFFEILDEKEESVTLEDVSITINTLK